MPTDNLYPVPVKTQANGHILVEDGATNGARAGVNLYDENGNLIPPENLDAPALIAAHRTEANAHPISSITNLQASLDAKANDNAVVHIAGAENITGIKRFTGGEIAVDNYAGVPTDGVIRFGNDNNGYIWKQGSSFRFKAGLTGEAVLDASGTVLTTVNAPNWHVVNNGGRLGAAAMIVPGDNWNNALDSGWYMSSSAANAPTAGVWYIGIVTQHNTDWVTQEVWDFTGGADKPRYRRQKVNGTWSAWTTKIRTTDAPEFGSRMYVTDSNNTAAPVAGGKAFGVYYSSGFYDGATMFAYDYTAGTHKPMRVEASEWNFNVNGGATAVRMNSAGLSLNAANGAAMVRVPRTFVQSTDPGAQASDGDLWFW